MKAPWRSPPHDCSWKSSCVHSLPSPSEIHIWLCWLDQDPLVLRDLETSLSDDERKRASTFARSQDRLHFIARRGTLRALIASYLRCSSADIRFQYNHFGKPFISQPQLPLQFNAARSGSLFLVAIDQHEDVGVDIEEIAPLDNIWGIAATCFCNEEIVELSAVSEDHRLLTFLSGWTRKEAVAKLLGTGFSFSPKDIRVTLDPTRPAHLRSMPYLTHDSSALIIHSLRPTRTSIAAVAANRQRLHMRCACWSGPP